jgi:hypothetical protein
MRRFVSISLVQWMPPVVLRLPSVSHRADVRHLKLKSLVFNAVIGGCAENSVRESAAR